MTGVVGTLDVLNLDPRLVSLSSVQMYKDSGMWDDALRVARLHVPRMMAAIQAEKMNAVAATPGLRLLFSHHAYCPHSPVGGLSEQTAVWIYGFKLLTISHAHIVFVKLRQIMSDCCVVSVRVTASLAHSQFVGSDCLCPSFCACLFHGLTWMSASPAQLRIRTTT